MSQRKSKNDTISCSQNTVNECVKYIFCREGSKIPIKRSDIINHLSETCEVSKQHAIIILTAAQRELKRVYGYDLVELKLKDGIYFIVVLDQPSESMLSSFTDPFHRRVLIASLTHIFMSNGPVPEDDMWKFLSEAYVLEENDVNGRKLLANTFTKQLYLTRYKDGEAEQAKIVYDWGPRAQRELPKMFILDKVAKALDQDPKHWTEQYKQASINNRD